MKWRPDLSSGIHEGDRADKFFNIVEDFNAVGDGVTDDSQAFKDARDFWKDNIRTNLAPGSNSNKLGTVVILLPPGDYLIKDNEVFMDSAFTTRSISMEWIGTGWQGGCQILYQPTSSGALVHNNDAVLAMRFKNIEFSCNSATNDFCFSTSDGGSQRYMFDHCSWVGTWRYGLHLKGTDTNDNFTFNDCWWRGTWTAFLFSESNDQFINYWFNRGSVVLFTGNFVKMTLGGHVKIDGTAFSVYAPSSTNYLFRLEGSTHNQGTCSFTCKNSRLELNNGNALVLYSEWPFGTISFEDCDFSSQIGQAHDDTIVPFHFEVGNVQAASIRFTSCSLIGKHRYRVDNSGPDMKKTVVYEGCEASAFRDFYDMFDVAMNSGTNVGGLPCLKTTKCRGKQENYSTTFTAWVASTAYSIGDQRRGGNWLYECTVAGTSSATQPTGAGSAIVDNTVTWKSLTIYKSLDYITEGGFGSHQTRSVAGGRKIAVIRNATGSWPARVSATVKESARIVLPPNSLMTGVYLDLPANVLTEANNGTYHVKTDEGTATTFINITSPGNLSAGFSAEWKGSFDVGASLDKRAIILEAQTDVEQAAAHPALCLIEYISGD